MVVAGLEVEFGEVVCGDGCGYEDEDDDEQFLDREACSDQEAVEHGGEESGAEADGGGFGGGVEALHSVLEADQAVASDQAEGSCDDEEEGDECV